MEPEAQHTLCMQVRRGVHVCINKCIRTRLGEMCTGIWNMLHACTTATADTQGSHRPRITEEDVSRRLVGEADCVGERVRLKHKHTRSSLAILARGSEW